MVLHRQSGSLLCYVASAEQRSFLAQLRYLGDDRRRQDLQQTILYWAGNTQPPTMCLPIMRSVPAAKMICPPRHDTRILKACTCLLPRRQQTFIATFSSLSLSLRRQHKRSNPSWSSGCGHLHQLPLIDLCLVARARHALRQDCLSGSFVGLGTRSD